MKDVLGIIGGMSPKATAYFYDLITDMTKVTKDQDHINMIIYSDASTPDRTSYILGKSTNSPLPNLTEAINFFNNVDCKMIAITCNTSCYFYRNMQEKTNIPVNNIIEDTIKYLVKSGTKKVGIFASTGTVETKLYQNLCDKYNISYEILNENNQEKVMSIIYDNIKINKPVNFNNLDSIIEYMKNKGVEKIILGCTELSTIKDYPLLKNLYVDPLEIQALKIIKFFNKTLDEKYKHLDI